ncbi:MAG TPA: OsmC family protein [Phenylobacterium sp.]|nr:OsmC family protein [Phenylobacterium sp.]
MATYRATSEWALEAGGDFPNGRYSRGHSLVFGSGVEVPGTASHHVVGNKWSVAGAVDPEEMLVGSINTCHMLTFLHIAREAGFVVTRYRDEAEGVMTKRDDGEMWVSKVILRPQIAYEGRRPTPGERDQMHEKAHHMCFIANSVKTEIVVEEVVAA